ncbi:4-hydroxy-tetrahydrodipicolinate synthase (EC [Olavius sp. associated proteobacterium Delta 1]|nr:4-hydroxy-tetrahydrodipicolinate synthase (EC [Olavius sp. associated proteobacterium Delta 1]
MMSEINLHGIFPPIPTPFINANVAYDKLASNIEKWSKTGLRGLVVMGSNGEYVYLSTDEKRMLVEKSVELTPDHMLVIAGTGCESTQETIELTRDCADRGAHAALVVTPHYYGGRMNEAALVAYFIAVADNSPIPILLYNVPKFTHVNMTFRLVAQLSSHPNIVGIKDSTGNVIQLGEFANNVDAEFNLLVGTAGALFGGLTLGCAGGVLALANVAPDNCVKIYEYARQGNYEAARQLQLKMIPVNQAVTATYGVPGLKAAMDMLGYFGGDPRPPLLPSSEKEKSEIREILINADLLKS